MNLNEISEDDVRRAAALHDELGREDFLRRYGFGSARNYELVIDGRTYPSKAIVGVAHEYATGVALSKDEFSGGRQQTVPTLERLGFEVVASRGALANDEAFMLLWNPNGYKWPDEDRLAILSGTIDGVTVRERWSIYANSTKVAVGDRIFLRKTGTPPRGVIASGVVSGPPIRDSHWSDDGGRPALYVDIDWDAMVEPGDVLDLADIADRFPSATWTAPGGGARVPPESRGALEQAWDAHVDRTVTSYQVPPEGNLSHEQEINARYGRALVKVRRHQRAFRELLLRELAHECEYPGCGVTSVEVLEAAHIIPDSEGGKPILENGLLLCRNHHRAMDSHLVRYEGDDTFTWADGVEPF